MGPFNLLRQKIKDVLLEDTTYIQEVYMEERSTFTGSPAAIVSVSTNEALYNSQKDDKLTFVFNIRLYVPLVDESKHAEAELIMGEVYWYVLNQFTKRDVLAEHADFCEPVPSIWSFESSANGPVYRVAEINLRCRKHLNQRS